MLNLCQLCYAFIMQKKEFMYRFRAVENALRQRTSLPIGMSFTAVIRELHQNQTFHDDTVRSIMLAWDERNAIEGGREAPEMVPENAVVALTTIEAKLSGV